MKERESVAYHNAYDESTKFMTSREKYNYYSQCLSNNKECPASEGWRKKRGEARRLMDYEENRFKKLETKIEDLEKRVEELNEAIINKEYIVEADYFKDKGLVEKGGTNNPPKSCLNERPSSVKKNKM